MLRPHYSRADDEARALLREAFTLSGDLVSTPVAGCHRRIISVATRWWKLVGGGLTTSSPSMIS